MKRVSVILIGIVSIANLDTPCAIAAPGTPQSTIIRAEHLYTGDGQVLSPGAVLLKNGKIVEVAESIDSDEAEVMTVHSLIPGLVDAYANSGLQGQDAERTEEFTPHLKTVSILDWTDREFREQVAAGSTTLNIVPGTNNVVAGQACIVKSAGDVSNRVLESSSGVCLSVCSDPTSGNSSRSRPDSIYIRQPTNRMGVVWLLRNAFHVAKGNNDTAPAITRILEGETPVFAVSRTQYDIEALISIANEFEFQPILVGGQESWRVVSELAEQDISVVLQRTVPGSSQGMERTRICAETAVRLNEREIPFCFSQSDLLNQARFAVRFGLSRESALQAITSSPAKILQIEDRVGTIAAGKDADLVALDGDPLQFTSAVRWVMVDGAVHFQQDGK
jgi:imidazolonepropionase-like amidohydrolase